LPTASWPAGSAARHGMQRLDVEKRLSAKDAEDAKKTRREKRAHSPMGFVCFTPVRFS